MSTHYDSLMQGANQNLRSSSTISGVGTVSRTDPSVSNGLINPELIAKYSANSSVERPAMSLPLQNPHIHFARL